MKCHFCNNKQQSFNIQKNQQLIKKELTLDYKPEFVHTDITFIPYVKETKIQIYVCDKCSLIINDTINNQKIINQSNKKMTIRKTCDVCYSRKYPRLNIIKFPIIKNWKNITKKNIHICEQCMNFILLTLKMNKLYVECKNIACKNEDK